jgi:hypothetical protein
VVVVESATAACVRCRRLNLHVNQLTGSIPSTLGNLSAVE